MLFLYEILKCSNKCCFSLFYIGISFSQDTNGLSGTFKIEPLKCNVLCEPPFRPLTRIFQPIATLSFSTNVPFAALSFLGVVITFLFLSDCHERAVSQLCYVPQSSVSSFLHFGIDSLRLVFLINYKFIV